MTELIELRPVKTVKQRRSQRKLYAYETATIVPYTENHESSSDDESAILLNLKSKPKKSSKRNNTIQTVPIIVNAQPVKEKKDKHEHQIQQFVINAQPPPPSSPKKKEIIFNPNVEYIPVSAPTRSFQRIVERYPYEYRHIYTPSLIDERPFDYYGSYELPARRIVRNYPSNSRNVHLPPHAKRLVNRFIDRLEDTHNYRYLDGNGYDHSIDDCRVCRRLRSAMDYNRRRTCSEDDVCHCHRTCHDTHGSHAHIHDHSNDCKVCNLLAKSDFVISKTEEQSKATRKKQDKQVHIVESVPSKIKSVEQTTTTTTTAAATNQQAAVSSLPVNASYYPMQHTYYVDPYTGITYAYDPYATNTGYDYSSYYTYPNYLPSHSQYQINNSTLPFVTTNPLNPTTQTTTTTTAVEPNPLIDTGTYTNMPTKRKKEKPANQTVIVHNARNPTPPTPKIIIEQPRRVRLPRKIKTKTILKEHSTQTPHTTTTTYVQT